MILSLIVAVSKTAEPTQPAGTGMAFGWLADVFQRLVTLFNGYWSFAGVLIVAGALAWAATIEVRRSYLFLRRVYAGELAGRRWPVICTITTIVLRNGVWRKLRERPLFKRVRMRVEHTIFRPEPVFAWPPRSGDKAHAEFVERKKGFTQSSARRRFAKERKRWRKEMRGIYAPKHQDIVIESPAELNQKFAAIKRYFDVLKTVDLEDEEDPHRFICHIAINEGFISPIHLLTGLLVHFDSSWNTIIKAFDRDASQIGNLARAGENALDIRQIQMFIYNCWLLWGPSIPMCTCPQWHARFKVLQYGFGDENNSIEIVGSNEAIDRQLDALARPIDNETLRPMALPAEVRGMLQLSGSFKGRLEKDISALPLAARQSWVGNQDERPLLCVSVIKNGDVTKDQHGFAIEETGFIGPPTKGTLHQSKYYSAYLWIALCIIKPEEAHREAAWPALGKREAWKSLVPFFEHGNLADPETCQFGKRQLAAKVLSAIIRMVRDWDKDEPPRLRFAYACAIDDTGCSKPLAYPKWTGSMTIRALLELALDEGVAAHGETSIYGRIRNEKIIDFDHYGERGDNREYSACMFPAHVAEHYRSMQNLGDKG